MKFIIRRRRKKFFKQEFERLTRVIWKLELREAAIIKIKEGMRQEFEFIAEQLFATQTEVKRVKALKDRKKVDYKRLKGLVQKEVGLKKDTDALEKQILGFDKEIEAVKDKKQGAREYRKVIGELIKKL